MVQIYLLTNKINGKIYVGQTRRPLARYCYDQGWKARNLSGRSKPRLYAAIRKYGIDSFEMSLVDCFTQQSDADFVEILLIYALRTQDHAFGYNVADGGGGRAGLPAWNRGIKMSAEFSKKCSVGQKARFLNKPGPRQGIKMSEQQKSQISRVLKERGISPSPAARLLAAQVHQQKKAARAGS